MSSANVTDAARPVAGKQTTKTQTSTPESVDLLGGLADLAAADHTKALATYRSALAEASAGVAVSPGRVAEIGAALRVLNVSVAEFRADAATFKTYSELTAQAERLPSKENRAAQYDRDNAEVKRLLKLADDSAVEARMLRANLDTRAASAVALEQRIEELRKAHPRIFAPDSPAPPSAAHPAKATPPTPAAPASAAAAPATPKKGPAAEAKPTPARAAKAVADPLGNFTPFDPASGTLASSPPPAVGSDFVAARNAPGAGEFPGRDLRRQMLDADESWPTGSEPAPMKTVV